MWMLKIIITKYKEPNKWCMPLRFDDFEEATNFIKKHDDYRVVEEGYEIIYQLYQKEVQ